LLKRNLAVSIFAFFCVLNFALGSFVEVVFVLVFVFAFVLVRFDFAFFGIIESPLGYSRSVIILKQRLQLHSAEEKVSSTADYRRRL
jgi:hypothetical protein